MELVKHQESMMERVKSYPVQLHCYDILKGDDNSNHGNGTTGDREGQGDLTGDMSKNGDTNENMSWAKKGDITSWVASLCGRLKVISNSGYGSYVFFFCYPNR